MTTIKGILYDSKTGFIYQSIKPPLNEERLKTLGTGTSQMIVDISHTIVRRKVDITQNPPVLIPMEYGEKLPIAKPTDSVKLIDKLKERQQNRQK